MTWPTSEQSTLHRSREYSSPSVTDRISPSKLSKYSLRKKKKKKKIKYYIIIITFIFTKCINLIIIIPPVQNIFIFIDLHCN